MFRTHFILESKCTNMSLSNNGAFVKYQWPPSFSQKYGQGNNYDLLLHQIVFIVLFSISLSRDNYIDCRCHKFFEDGDVGEGVVSCLKIVAQIDACDRRGGDIYCFTFTSVILHILSVNY